MLGIFDSGVGGLTALCELRKIHPTLDLCFLSDFENAPYGTKSRKELIALVKKDITRLIDAGADKILMACCTASSVHPYLPQEMQRISVPIISPTARDASYATQNGKVCVIATNATVNSEAFPRELSRYKNIKRVFSLKTQELVTLVESGYDDRNITENQRERIVRLLSPIKDTDADTLILGCTHFPRLTKTIAGILPKMKLISSSYSGAVEIAKDVPRYQCGETIYL